MRGEAGQAALEWVGLVALVAMVLTAGLVGAGKAPEVGDAGRAVADAFLCAAGVEDRCGAEGIEGMYGEEVAALVRRHAPTIRYQSGSASMPVDYRHCLGTPSCAWGRKEGQVGRSHDGLPATAFTHVVDRRQRGGSLYLQYWLYYPESLTGGSGVPGVRKLMEGTRAFHLHDWESYQVRIGPDGKAESRAGSHHGHQYARTRNPWSADRHRGWGPSTGGVDVSGGSHAGAAKPEPRVERWVAGAAEEVAWGPLLPAALRRKRNREPRTTPARELQLLPIEPLADADRSFGSVTPPWRKRVYRDPEAPGTS